MMHLRIRRGERGAAAVEFALVLPLLLLLVLGIVEFGRVYNVQISLSNAAREGARVMAIQNDQGEARTAAIAAAPSVNPQISSVGFSPASCTAGGQMKVTINYDLEYLSGYELFPGQGPSISLKGIGVMRCGG